MKRQQVAYVTGSRAEFGIVLPLLRCIKNDPTFQLQVYVTGMHLMETHGETVELVKKEFPAVTSIPATYSTDTTTASSQFLAEFLPKLTTAFIKNRPDFAIVHGDRAEMLAVALVCLYLHIPVIHTQGGDQTRTDDNTARHVISKLSQLHFPATEQAKQCLLSLGEPADRVHVVGTLSLDTVLNASKISKTAILQSLQLPAYEKYILITQHPESETAQEAGNQMKILLTAARDTQLPILIIYPNADPGSTQMIAEIEKIRREAQVHIFKNIPYEQFIQLSRHASVWIGNSSACVVDAPALHIPTVLVGNRQNGRELAENILHTSNDYNEICNALLKAISDAEFHKKVETCHNPWGDGHAVNRIMHILTKINFSSLITEKGKNATK